MATRTKFRSNLTDKLVQDIVTNLDRIKGCKFIRGFISSEINYEDAVKQIVKLVNDGYKEHLRKLSQQI
jgi:hypothetical protein